MKKRTLILILVVLLVAGMTSVAFAAPQPSPTVPPTAASSDSAQYTAKAASEPDTTAPTATPTPTVPPVTVGGLTIDGGYIGYGMDKTYSQGYTPSTAGGVASVVLPLTGPKTMTGNIYCTLSLGGENGPFVISNYDNIPFAPEHPEQAMNFFVARFSVPLKADRTNGTYPLGISVRYTDQGVETVQDFSVNVNITDGKAEATPNPSTGPVSQPKVIMSNYTVTPDPCYAGDVFTVVATLKNTSKESAVKNLTVNYKSQTTDLIPEDGASTSFIDSIGAGDSAQFTFKMEARADAKPGPQKIDVALSYEDAKANAYTATDEITVQVRQQIRLEYDDPKFPTAVYMGDSLSTTLNLYNKGKNTLYNVTVDLEVPGITPDSSAFLGNMESGASKSADIYATVDAGGMMAGGVDMNGGMEGAEAGSVTVVGGADAAAGEAMPASGGAEEALPGDEGNAAFGGAAPGPVEGNFVVTYEDEYGDHYDLKIPVKTELMEMQQFDPGMDPGMDMPEEPQTGFPWWAWIIIAGGAAIVVIVIVRKRKKAKRERELMEDMDDDDIS